MKITAILMIAATLAYSCQREASYSIHGKFTGAPEGTVVYLGQDSARIDKGEFVFHGKADFPVLSTLGVKGTNSYGMPGLKGTPIWLENTDMQITGLWDSLPDIFAFSERIRISGSPLNEQYSNFRQQSAALGKNRNNLWKQYQKVYLVPAFKWENVKVADGMEVMQKIQNIASQRRQLSVDFISEHPDSPVSVYLLTGLLQGQHYTVAEAEKMISILDTSLISLPGYQQMLQAFKSFKPTAKGEKYIDATLRDKNGKEVKLSEVIQPGKYNMLEFWASWCSPCRGEIPHLRHVNRVLSDQFNIISISIDQKESDWKKAMEEENMTWTQLNEAQGFNGETVRKYGINGVPYSLVLDGEGRIVAGEVRGAELDLLLTELLGKSAEKLTK